MANSIFASLASQEDRQICELMAARNLGTSDCESILFLTGISATSPYYCPPSIRSRGLFRYLKERAMRLVSRIEKIPTISLVSPITENTAPITAPARVLVPDDQHPLSMSTISEPIEHSANEEPSSSSPPPQGAGPSTLFASLLSYQSTIAVRLANILSLAQAQQTTPAQEQITSLQVEESEEKVQPTSSVSPSRATGKNTIYRATSSRTPFKTLLRTLATSARRRRAQGSAASSDSGTTKPIDQAVSSVPNPNVIALSKSSPIQRLKAAAFRAIPASLTPSSEETNRMDAIKCAPPEQPHPVVRPQLSKLQTQLNRDLKPECLDQSLAEAHRKALLNKYFGPSGSNNRQANAILYTSSLRRSSSDDVAGKSCSEAIIDNEGMDDDDDLVGATDIESSSDEDTLYTGESVEPAQDSLSEGSKSVLYDSADSTFSKAAWSSSSTPLSKPGIQLTNSMPLAGIV
ncbi:hypothetical protein FRC20_007282 [Serendipita sp. 405]|nr:hypothetical protein FRC20_007282 [Serendipita sp. 405]